MKRLIKVQGTLQEEKFILMEEYEGFGIYQEKCPAGYFVHQSWLITNEDVTVIFYSFMNYCKEELMDAIDNYNDIKKFGIKAMPHPNKTYVAHKCGKVII